MSLDEQMVFKDYAVVNSTTLQRHRHMPRPTPLDFTYIDLGSYIVTLEPTWRIWILTGTSESVLGSF